MLQGKPYDSAVDWWTFGSNPTPTPNSSPGPLPLPLTPTPHTRWTFGCLVFEMITGRSPFKSEDMADMVQLLLPSYHP